MKVAILGCGPAGLLAAHAAELCGHRPTILSRKVRSVMPGAQYIHEAIPELRLRSALIAYRKVGTREGYARKVYGREDAPCSWDSFPSGLVCGWSMTEAYDQLWERYERRIVEAEMDEEMLSRMDRWDKVISAIPAPALCFEGCRFDSVEVGIIPVSRITNGIFRDPFIVYSGDPLHAWYRVSSIFGHASTEYGAAMLGSRVDMIRGRKPLGNTCTCRPHIQRVGRFGQWKKGVLVHSAFWEVLNALQ